MSDDLVIQRATRAQVKLRIALQAVSGGGKTATSLLLAKGMIAELARRGKLPDLPCHIGLLDTERDSASLYSHLVEFDTLPLAPPYTVDRYLEGLTKLIRAGYSVIIMDQITHEWHGDGGILAWVRDIQAKGGNEYTAWKKPSEAHDRFIDAILNCPTHIICTMRSKTAYALEKNEKGKMVPTRVGLQARQRDGTEYEFTTVLDLAAGTNAATCHKDRTELFKVGEVYPRMDESWGRRLIEWVYSASRPAPVAAEVAAEDRCVAVTDAGIRACERSPNLPDLQTVYLAQVDAIKAFHTDAGVEVVKRESLRLAAAKDARKAALGSMGGNLSTPSSELISADDLVNLELLLSDAGILAADVKTKFSVPRLAALPVSQWDQVVNWVVAEAGKRGIELRPIAHVPDVEQRAPSPLEVVRGMQEKIGRSRGGLFSENAPPLGSGFADMPDDLPWSDDRSAA